MYYPPVIRASGSLGFGSKAGSISNEVDEGKKSPNKALPTANISPEAVEQFKDAKKAANTTYEVARDAYLPPVAPIEPPNEKEVSHSIEIVLATLPIPFKEDLKGKGPASTTTSSTSLQRLKRISL